MKSQLWNIAIRSKKRVVEFSKDMNASYRKRLEELGFRMNCEVMCLQKLPFSGPLVIEISGGVFSLSKELASQIWVEDLN